MRRDGAPVNSKESTKSHAVVKCRELSRKRGVVSVVAFLKPGSLSFLKLNDLIRKMVSGLKKTLMICQ